MKFSWSRLYALVLLFVFLGAGVFEGCIYLFNAHTGGTLALCIAILVIAGPVLIGTGCKIYDELSGD